MYPKCNVCEYQFGASGDRYVAKDKIGYVCEGCIFKQK